MILINGDYKNQINTSDRGLNYGDGLFETIAVIDGQPVFWHQHWIRLESGCHRLKLPAPDPQLIKQEVQTLCQSAESAVLKIIITRGSGGRGYRQPETLSPTRILSLHPWPDYPKSYQDQGIVARFCDTRLGLNPSLAGIKHLNRLEQVMARAEWNDTAIQEGIMLDCNDHVIEGTMTNLFYVKNGKLHTSSIAQAGIAGIIRSIILNLSHDHKLAVLEHSFFKNELLAADELFFCNSIIGIWPVNQIANKHFEIGPVTRQIQQWLGQITQQTLKQ
jgi:4-amino-4-deoxychorismate lyase